MLAWPPIRRRRPPMRALVLVLAFLIAAAAPAWAQSPPADWKPWRYPDLHVALRAPPQAQPTVKYAKIEIPAAGDYPAVTVSNDQVLALDAGQYAMMVGVSDWSGNS